MNTKRIRSPESRLKISAAKLGKPLTAAHRAAISAGMAGKTFTAERRRTMSEVRKGRSPSVETRAKISAGVKVALKAKREAAA
jgi:NUMOD3 motif